MNSKDNTSAERRELIRLFRELCRQPLHPFPAARQRLKAPCSQGVYIIRDSAQRIAHVGRSRTGGEGICGRLKQHLANKSSFVYYHLDQNPARLRSGYTFQYLEVPARRTRALLEALAAGLLCPIHIDGKADE